MSSLPQAAAALGPWWFRFEYNGVPFGGAVERDREKTDWFFSALASLGGQPRRILELGSHEGSHSLQLAERSFVEEVVALEGRPATLARALFTKRVFGDRKVVFRQYDVERLEPADVGQRFDAVFCAGLLYHLPRPWDLIERLPALTSRFVFLDTHYAAAREVTVEGHAGSWFAEGRDPLSGLSPYSFWLTLEDLTHTLRSRDFTVRCFRDMPEFPKGPRAFILAERGSAG